MKNKITVVRRTTESEITVCIRKGRPAEDYRKQIKTPLPFLNHMIEHIAWRASMTIGVAVTLDMFDLVHLVCEDVGMTLGRAVGEFVRQNMPSGYGVGIGVIDEAQASAALSFEDRALFDFTAVPTYPEQVEGMPGEELLTFLDAFAQGARCTLHVDLKKGVNGHHIWEAVYRAVGIALGAAMETDPNRAGMTAGVAGKVTYEVQSESV